MRTPHRTHFIPLLVLVIGTMSCSFPVDNPKLTPTPDLRMTTTALMNAIGSPESSLTAVDSTQSADLPPEIDRQIAEIDPYVEISASAMDIVVGEELTVVGRPVDIHQPQYEIVLRDEGVQEALPLAMVTIENQVIIGDGRSQVLELVSVEAGIDQVVVTFRGIASGVVSVDINATGEIYTSENSASIIGMGSGSVLVVVGDE